MKSRVHPKYKTKYRVSNWAEYDRALVERGNITLWISDDAIACGFSISVRRGIIELFFTRIQSVNGEW